MIVKMIFYKAVCPFCKKVNVTIKDIKDWAEICGHFNEISEFSGLAHFYEDDDDRYAPYEVIKKEVEI